jgi:hypothetical protein
MSASNTVQQLNCEFAEKLNEDALRTPQTPYAGKRVGITNGQVVTAKNGSPSRLASFSAILTP